MWNVQLLLMLLHFSFISYAMEDKPITQIIDNKFYTFRKNSDQCSTELMLAGISYYKGYTHAALERCGSLDNSSVVFVKKNAFEQLWAENNPLIEIIKAKNKSLACAIEYKNDDTNDCEAHYLWAGKETDIFDPQAFAALNKKNFIVVEKQIPIPLKKENAIKEYSYTQVVIANTQDKKDGHAFLRRLKRDFIYAAAKNLLLQRPDCPSNIICPQPYHPWWKKTVVHEVNSGLELVGTLKEVITEDAKALAKQHMQEGNYTVCSGKDFSITSDEEMSSSNEEVIVLLTSHHTQELCQKVKAWKDQKNSKTG